MLNSKSLQLDGYELEEYLQPRESESVRSIFCLNKQLRKDGSKKRA